MSSKASDVRSTPQFIVDALDREFHFAIDAAANRSNCKVHHSHKGTRVPSYFGPDHDDPAMRNALALPWFEIASTLAYNLALPCVSIWLNPPYSAGSVWKWLDKAEREAEFGLTTVALTGADSSTRWYHRYVLAHEHRKLRQRFAFEGAPLTKEGKLAPAMFSSVLTVIRQSNENQLWTPCGPAYPISFAKQEFATERKRRSTRKKAETAGHGSIF